MNFQYTANTEEEVSTQNTVAAATHSQPILLVNTFPIYLDQPCFTDTVMLTDCNGQIIAIV